jgi:hypothetical protein
MKIFVLATAAALAAALSASAVAAPPGAKSDKPKKEHDSARPVTPSVTYEYTSGVVQGYSPDTQLLKLNNGAAFKLAPVVAGGTYSAGEKVTIRWTMKSGVRIASEVKPAP